MRAWISVTDLPARFGKADVRAFASACHIKNQQVAEQRRGEARRGQGRVWDQNITSYLHNRCVIL